MVGENAYFLLEAGMIADYLEQKRIIKLGDLDWKNDFLFGMILPKLKKETFDKAFENPFYQVNDKKRRALQREYIVEMYGCSIEKPIVLGCLAYLYLKNKRRKENDIFRHKEKTAKRMMRKIMENVPQKFTKQPEFSAPIIQYKVKYKKFIGEEEFNEKVKNKLSISNEEWKEIDQIDQKELEWYAR